MTKPAASASFEVKAGDAVPPIDDQPNPIEGAIVATTSVDRAATARVPSIAHVSALLAIAISYCGMLGVVYLYSFWSPFDVAPFQYAGLTDLASAAAPTALVSTLSIIFGSFLGYISADSDTEAPTRDKNRDGHYLEHPRKADALAVVSLLIAGFVFFYLANVWQPTLPYAAVFLTLPAMRAAIFFESVRRTLTGRSLILIIFLVLTCPLFVAGSGRADAAKAADPSRGRSVDLSRSTLVAGSKSALMYLGRLGSTNILFEMPAGTVVLMEVSSEQPLYLLRPPRPV